MIRNEIKQFFDSQFMGTYTLFPPVPKKRRNFRRYNQNQCEDEDEEEEEKDNAFETILANNEDNLEIYKMNDEQRYYIFQYFQNN